MAVPGCSGLVVVLCAALPAAPPPAGSGGDCSRAGCHDTFAGSAVVHAPVAGGSCDSCHEPIGAEKHRFRLVASGGELCLDCHDELTEELDFVHGPVAAGACTACHDPHASANRVLLVAAGSALCLECHEEMAERIADSPAVHEPVRGQCRACHAGHGGDNPMNLKQAPPGLCFDCHDQVEEFLDDATVQHPALESVRSCLKCHDPHASGHRPVLRAAPTAVCAACHEKVLAPAAGAAGGDPAGEAQVHGAIAQGGCTACHQPHGGVRFRMLIADYPASFYSAFSEESYALCFECHDTEIFEDPETDEATGFRNGDRNLHYLHVHREVKGRTCRACHAVHVASRPKMIGGGAKFGGWQIPIDYRKTATGGSCLPGCHRRYGYDRESPVANLPVASR